jgi:hypothetical protein
MDIGRRDSRHDERRQGYMIRTKAPIRPWPLCPTHKPVIPTSPMLAVSFARLHPDKNRY